MDLILDTCGLLSLVGLADKKLSAKTRKFIADANSVYISSCSMFEIAIKHKKSALDLGIFKTADELWTIAIAEYELTELPVNKNDFYQSVQLPDIHADPFDRIIIAQAQIRGIPIITFDTAFKQYDVVLFA